MSSSHHPNAITAGCPTASGNSDTLYYNYVSRARSSQHFRPRQPRDEIWLQHEPSFFTVWARMSTHRVGIVGIGPWPSGPGAPGWEERAEFSRILHIRTWREGLNPATRTCSLLAYRDPLCCVGVSCLRQNSATIKTKITIIAPFSRCKCNLLQQGRELINMHIQHEDEMLKIAILSHKQKSILDFNRIHT